MTVWGTVASVVSLLLSCTSRGVSVTILRVTVAIALPPFSAIPPLGILRVKVTPSLSITATVLELLTNPEAEAIIV